MSDLAVEVFVEMSPATIRAGAAFFHHQHRAVSTTFIYDPGWLAHRRAYPLDPALPLTGGSHFAEGLPGCFGDSAPDRWGRNLIDKHARQEAAPAHGAAPSLSDIDYLLRVSDLTRHGALRFRITGRDAFVAPDQDVPKLIELPKLLRAADTVARDTGDDREAVKALLDAGTGSLGGARPKATVRSDEGRLLIAKFPHHHDRWDVGRWEKTALDLAGRAGVAVPRARLVPMGPGAALLLERFDRGDDHARIPYISALTLLSGRDGETFDYEDLAAALEEAGAGDDAELAALFRRIVVSVAIHNTDDHLRNTGFIRARDGWRLSPAFDINPNPDLGTTRQTTIGSADHVADEPDGLMHLARWCHLDATAARAVIGEVLAAVADWRGVASRNGAPAVEVERFAEALDHRHRALAELVGSRPIAPTPPGRGSTQIRRPRGTPEGGRFTSKPRAEGDPDRST